MRKVGLMEILIILIVVIVSKECTHVKTCEIEYVRYVYFSMLKLIYFSKTGKFKCKKDVVPCAYDIIFKIPF